MRMNRVTMPAGTYRLGDPCYSVPSKRWLEWLESANYLTAYEKLLADLDGKPVLGFATKYGDGEYPGSDGFRYGVDAGLIGLVPVEVADRDDLYGNEPPWTVVTFEEEVLCTRDEHGTLTFGHIVIETGDEDEEGYY